MSNFEVLPNILWKVENLWGNEKKCSGVISFLGMNWRLKMLILPEVCGLKLKLILKRLGPSSLSQDTNFIVETCVLKQYGSGELFKQSLSTNLNYKEWCVWSQLKSEVEKQESVNYRNSIVFLVVITPGDKWLTILHGVYKKKPPTPNAPPCLQGLSSDLAQLFDNEDNSDVKVVVADGRSFHAHRAILCARSPVFAAMLRSDMRENREGVITVSDADPGLVERFLRYLYVGDLGTGGASGSGSLGADEARRMHALADRYAVDALRSRCALAVADSYRSGAETQVPRQSGQPLTFLNQEQGLELRKKELTKQLLVSKEWRCLADEYPKLAADMCAPLMVVPPSPPPSQEEDAPAVEEKKPDVATS